MKKKLFYTLMFITIILLAYLSKIHFKEKETLTKDIICDIINNIDKTLLGSISKTGKKELSDESKLDYMIRYLITNKQKYNDYISYSDLQLEKDGTIYYNFGKVKSEYMYEKIKELFLNFNYNIESKEIYKDGYITLFYEPAEYVSYDSKELVDFAIKGDKTYTYVKYVRTLGNKTNEFIVEYIIDRYMYKVENVIICNSYMN